MIEPFLKANIVSLSDWQTWGVVIAFAITSVTSCWIFYDSQRNLLGASFWRVISLLAALIVTPSATLRLFPYLQNGLPEQVLLLMATAGVLATAISFAGLILYALGIGVKVYPKAPHMEVDPLPTVPDAVTIPPESANAVTLPLRDTDPLLPPEPEPKPKPDPAQLAWLVIVEGPQAGHPYPLAEITDIGREDSCNDIHLSDPALSRQHARIRFEEGRFVVYDLASANGTFVNGEPVERATLHNHDRLQMGQTHFAFMQVQIAKEDAEASEMPAGQSAQLELAY